MSFQGRASSFEAAGAPRLPAAIGFLASHGVSVEILIEAARRAETCGVTADVALLRTGLLDEAFFYRALARETGLPFKDAAFDAHPMAHFPEAILGGLVPLARDGPGELPFCYAPRGDAIVRLLAARDRIVPGLSLAAPSVIRDRVMAARAVRIAAAAADGLASASPDLSFHGGMTWRQTLAICFCSAVIAGLFVLAPAEIWLALSFAVSLAFLGSTTLRLAAVLEAVPTGPGSEPPRTADRDLPVYTVLVALYQEARVVPKLIGALSAIDYPAAKLEIILILEADDHETAAALRRERLPAHMQLIVAPPGEPRTKPRALNVALPLARGEFLTVYDAEDVPDPGQLRLAASVFARRDETVACLQARLVIDNADDCLLTRLFAIEYAALFDVGNPALARCDFPVPLGGTSNHFRTAILKGLGGWDAWNVTEDADLGIRLAAAGYRVSDLPSATLEEAPGRLGAWMRQRTRWMKGFVQVSITHSRRPLHNLRALGPARLGGAAAVTLGTVLSALFYPVLMLVGAEALVTGRLLTASTPAEIASAALGVTLFGAGMLALVLPPVLALCRRRWWSLLPLVPLMPFYFGLVSLAAWRGLAELLLAPERWNKTEHGFAKSSRGAGVTIAEADLAPLQPEPARG